jgi:hypothetical protein
MSRQLYSKYAIGERQDWEETDIFPKSRHRQNQGMTAI